MNYIILKKLFRSRILSHSEYPNSIYANFLSNQEFEILSEKIKDSLLNNVKETISLNKYVLAMNTIDSLINISASRDFRFSMYEQRLKIFGKIYNQKSIWRN